MTDRTTAARQVRKEGSFRICVGREYFVTEVEEAGEEENAP